MPADAPPFCERLAVDFFLCALPPPSFPEGRKPASGPNRFPLPLSRDARKDSRFLLASFEGRKAIFPLNSLPVPLIVQRSGLTAGFSPARVPAGFPENKQQDSLSARVLSSLFCEELTADFPIDIRRLPHAKRTALVDDLPYAMRHAPDALGAAEIFPLPRAGTLQRAILLINAALTDRAGRLARNPA